MHEIELAVRWYWLATDQAVRVQLWCWEQKQGTRGCGQESRSIKSVGETEYEYSARVLWLFHSLEFSEFSATLCSVLQPIAISSG